MADEKEEARVAFAKAKMEYSLIQQRIGKARRLLPPVEERSPEENTYWMLLCAKASNCSKAVIKAEQRKNNFEGKVKSTDSTTRIQELMAETDFEIEKKEIEEKLNPKKKPIFDLPGAMDIANAAAKFKPIYGPPNPLAKSKEENKEKELTSEEIDAESEKFLAEDLGLNQPEEKENESNEGRS